MSNPSATLSPGSLVGNYKILGLAGAGGMGVVYRALDTKLERTVALKFLPEHTTSSREDKDRFLREARTASSLDHANIGVIYGMEEYQSRSFIVMAYYEGETLSRKLLRGPLPVPEAVNIAIQIVEGLAAAHAGAVMHRDVKPSNVLVSLYDGKPVPRVIDFGVAKAIDQRLTERTLFTRHGAIVGTLEYMSPEQAENSSLDVDTRTDVYSLGVLLYELLTGTTPLEHQRLKDAGYREIVRRICEEEPPKLSTRLSKTRELVGLARRNGYRPDELIQMIRSLS